LMNCNLAKVGLLHWKLVLVISHSSLEICRY
jgi:hypothetical protein